MSLTRDEIDGRRLQLGFREALFCFELSDASRLFNDGAALHGLGGEDQADAALFDDGVGVWTQADAHEHLLDVAQAPGAAVDEVFALPGTVQPPADHHFTWFGGQNRLGRGFFATFEPVFRLGREFVAWSLGASGSIALGPSVFRPPLLRGARGQAR